MRRSQNIVIGLCDQCRIIRAPLPDRDQSRWPSKEIRHRADPRRGDPRHL